MIYEYKCSYCLRKWEESRPVADRDAPTTLECECGCYIGTIKRLVANSMTIDFMGKYSMEQRAGWGWNDLQKRIKSGSGRANTIQLR